MPFFLDNYENCIMFVNMVWALVLCDCVHDMNLVFNSKIHYGYTKKKGKI
jgi:hypothetical protein